MKKKSSIRIKKRNEIRFHADRVKNKKKKIRHPKYIWRERGNVYDYHSITHSQFVDGVEYKKLRKNPKPGDNRDAYYNPIVNQILNLVLESVLNGNCIQRTLMTF